MIATSGLWADSKPTVHPSWSSLTLDSLPILQPVNIPYWFIDPCLPVEGARKRLCVHSQPPARIFFPPFFSPFYQGMLAVQGAAGIRACKSTIYQLWMCPAPVSQSSLLVFLSFSHFLKKLCPKLWNTHPSLILILSYECLLSSTLPEIVIKSNMEQTVRRGLGKPTNSFSLLSVCCHIPLQASTLFPKTRVPPHSWFFNKKYSISFKSFIIQFWVILIVPISLLEK